MAKNNFIPLVGGGTQMPASAEAVADDIMRLDGAVSDLAEDVGTIENWDAGDISYDSSENYNDGTVGGSLNDLKSAVGENGANILSAYPTDTASGAIASFSDGAALPVKALTVSIRPVQSGSGDPAPDNVRPISGWTQAKVTRTGKNLLPKMVAGTYEGNGVKAVVDADGIATLSGTCNATGNAFIIQLQAPITITQKMVDAGLYYHVNNTDALASFAPGLESNNYVTTSFSVALSRPNSKPRVVQAVQSDVGKTISRIRFYCANGQACSGTYAPAIMFDSDADVAYAPFVDFDTFPITIPTPPGTVYGGTLDVLTGVLTVDSFYGHVDEIKTTWGIANGYAGCYRYISINSPNPDTSFHWPDSNGAIQLCNALKIQSVMPGYNREGIQIVNNSYLAIRLSADRLGLSGTESSAEIISAMNTWLASNPVYIVYPLATPLTVQLDPETFSTLLGANNVWADAGDVSVAYRADPTLYIRKLTGPVEDDMIADTNIANGQYFMVGNRLFLATAAIAAGAQLTIGTNCTETNLAAALNALNS